MVLILGILNMQSTSALCHATLMSGFMSTLSKIDHLNSNVSGNVE